MFSKFAVAFVLPALAAAQNYGGPPAGPATTAAATTSAPQVVPSAPATNAAGTMNIDVAFNGAFVFHPANISAPIGTLVTFWFPGGSIAHSVTQSSFAAPCIYLAANSSASTPGGFDSGLVTASTFTINVTDTDPIWFHCKQVTHCGSGMVGSINAPATGNTFDAFVSAAMSQGASEPTDTGPAVTGGVHGVATAAPSSDVGGSSSGSSSGSGTSSSDATRFVASAGVVMLSAAFAVMMMA